MFLQLFPMWGSLPTIFPSFGMFFLKLELIQDVGSVIVHHFGRWIPLWARGLPFVLYANVLLYLGCPNISLGDARLFLESLLCCPWVRSFFLVWVVQISLYFLCLLLYFCFLILTKRKKLRMKRTLDFFWKVLQTWMYWYIYDITVIKMSHSLGVWVWAFICVGLFSAIFPSGLFL